MWPTATGPDWKAASDSFLLFILFARTGTAAGCLAVSEYNAQYTMHALVGSYTRCVSLSIFGALGNLLAALILIHKYGEVSHNVFEARMLGVSLTRHSSADFFQNTASVLTVQRCFSSMCSCAPTCASASAPICTDGPNLTSELSDCQLTFFTANWEHPKSR